MSFGNPVFAGFLALASIPIIIYLINRQRYQRVRWAAMEFLLRAMRKNRKRLRLENLLLLIIRTLIILLFVLGMMRPFLSSNPLAVVGGRQSRSELFVIDRSMSMGLKEGQLTLLNKAVEGVTQQLKDLDKGDRVGLLLGGGTPERLTPDPEYLTEGDGLGLSNMLRLLEDVRLAHESLQLAFTLEDAMQWVRDKGARDSGGDGGWIIHFYTDLQKRDWLSDSNPDSAVRQALARLQEMQIPVVLHPLGPAKPRNTSLVELSCRDPLAAVDVATSFQVTVKNRCSEVFAQLEVELWVNGTVQASKSISLDPDAERTVSFPYVFREAGVNRVKAVVLSDSLEEDNAAYLTTLVRESVQILLVDGGFQEATDEAAFIDMALTTGGTNDAGVRLTPYETRVVAADRLTQVAFGDYDLIILANVGPLNTIVTNKIEAFLRDGGGILMYLGARVDVADLNTYQYRDGKGWFPFKGGRVIHDLERETTFHIDVVRKKHPAMSYLARESATQLGNVLVHGYLRPAMRVPESKVLAVLDDGFQTPWIVDGDFGDGKVMVVNTSPDRGWSNFPIFPAFLVFLHEALPYLASGKAINRNLGIGEPYQRVVDASEFAKRVFLIRPQGDGVPLVLKQRVDQNTFDLEAPGQREPGNFEIRFGEETSDSVRQEWFSVNGDPDEGILMRISPEEIQDTYPDAGDYLQVLEASRPQQDTATLPTQSSGEVWRDLFWAVLALLTVESVLARIFGGKRTAG